MALDIVIMAAGKGTRMKSALPKVLHRLAGTQPIAACAGHRAPALARDRTVVVTGHGADDGRARSRRARTLRFVRQEPQLGTGHAVQQAVPLLRRRRHDADPQRRRAADRGRHRARAGRRLRRRRSSRC